jgi:hypothetical protein
MSTEIIDVYAATGADHVIRGNGGGACAQEGSDLASSWENVEEDNWPLPTPTPNHKQQQQQQADASTMNCQRCNHT